mgnify:FL=1
MYGLSYSQRLKNRIIILKDMVRMLSVMNNHIGYSLIDMTQIFERLGDFDMCSYVRNFTGYIYEALNKSDIEETSQDMTGSGIEDSDAGSQSAEETAETESTEQTGSDFEGNTEQIETDAGQEEMQDPYIRQKEPYTGVPVYENLEHIYMNTTWEYADHSAISDGYAVLYKASGQRKNIVVGVNAGHGTAGGSAVRTLCHPDGSLKSTGGSTAAGAATATAVSGGMTFYDGTPESEVTLKMAEILRDKLLLEGYDVLMIRDSSDVQLDNVARTVICNNVADCHISVSYTHLRAHET